VDHVELFVSVLTRHQVLELGRTIGLNMRNAASDYFSRKVVA
jgi:hypothetical protein